MAMHLMLLIALSLGILMLDQATKQFFEIMLSDSAQAVLVTPFFNLALGYNRGISFGLLSSEHPYAPYLLALFALVIVIGLAVWMWRSNSLMQRLGLAAIIGGAISNLVDRLEDGAVTDFLDFHIGAYHWPTFNLADAAITCGVAVLLFESVWPRSSLMRRHGAGG
jgi:signal peptidase II